MTGHFWYSAKLEAYNTDPFMGKEHGQPKNYALIAGKEVRYNLMTTGPTTSARWDDLVYLGEGTYSRSEPI